MKVLFDTNVLLDVFLERKSFFGSSAQVVGLVEQGKIGPVPGLWIVHLVLGLVLLALLKPRV